MIPLVIVAGPRDAAANTHLARLSALRPDRVFHLAGSKLWARAGAVETLPPLLGRGLLFLASRGIVPAVDFFDALYADDPDGGPHSPRHVWCARVSQCRGELASLGLAIHTMNRRGVEAESLQIGAERRPKAEWIAEAAALRRAGLTWPAIAAKLACGYHEDGIRQATLYAMPELRGLPPARYGRATHDSWKYADPDLFTTPEHVRRQMAGYRAERWPRRAARDTASP